jgi:hypothetical protein
MSKHVRLALSAALALSLTAGCTSDSSPPSPSPSTDVGRQFPNWPASLNGFRFHWTAEPNIDITEGPTVPVRAYLESHDVASFTRNLDNAYPGFMRATPENDELDGHYLTQLARIRPLNGVEANPEDAVEHFGYIPYHFLRLDPIGDGFRAIVCEGKYADFMKSDMQPGKYVSVVADPKTAQIRRSDNAVYVHRIELTQHDPRVGPNPPAAVSAPQQGPAPAPDQDVFGNWFFTGASATFWGPIDDPQSREFPPPELERQCSERLPYTETERAAMMTGFKDRPPPHGQAEPGWPLKAN